MTTDRPAPPRPAGALSPVPSPRRFLSLRTKFLVSTLLVVSAVMSALVLIVEQRQRSAIIREVRQRGMVLARDLAAVSTPPLVLYNYTQLEQNVVRVDTETDDVAYAMILDRDGRVAAHSHRPESVGTLLSGVMLDRILSTDAPLAQELRSPAGEGLYDFSAPMVVDAQRWGTARVGLSRRRMDAEIADTRRQLILLAVLVLAGAGLASALVAQRIARPVRQLAVGAVAISRGELVQRVEPTTSDEIGQLAAAFNNMARQLHEQRSALLEGRTALEAAHGELRRRFAELSDLKSYTDHILDSLVNGIVTLDLEGRVVMLNGSAETLLGCVAADVRGRPLTEVLVHTPEVVAILQAAIQWRTGRSGTVTLPGRMGGTVPAEITTATLKGVEGQDLGVIVIVRDLTAVRALEAQLRHAQKMEAVGRLAGGVAHDFNNLLTVITGRSQLLLLKLQPESPLRRDVELVEETAHRASALTRQLLAFSRKQMVQPRIVDLNEVVRGMETMLSRLIGEDIALTTRLDPAAGCVRADPAQLEQMVVNLAVNARDAMPLGGRLTLETSYVRLDEGFARQHVGLAPGPHVRLTVRDTGVGMDGLIKAHLFEPFFTTKGPGKGTGLGLATVYGIVTQSGGAIRVESEPGQGATFTIELPRVDAPADRPTDSGIPAASPHGSETVLLVEDEPEVRGLARDILQQQGYTVLESADGDEALRIGREHVGPIHLLVTDVVMPLMGGRELADRLRAGRAETKVLYVSGYTDDAILHQGVSETGTAAFLPKPFTASALAHKVRQVLDAAPTNSGR